MSSCHCSVSVILDCLLARIGSTHDNTEIRPDFLSAIYDTTTSYTNTTSSYCQHLSGFLGFESRPRRGQARNAGGGIVPLHIPYIVSNHPIPLISSLPIRIHSSHLLLFLSLFLLCLIYLLSLSPPCLTACRQLRITICLFLPVSLLPSLYLSTTSISLSPSSSISLSPSSSSFHLRLHPRLSTSVPIQRVLNSAMYHLPSPISSFFTSVSL